MNYTIKPNSSTKIEETSGTIQNTDQINKVELSASENFESSIILYPLNNYFFSGSLYVRLLDNDGLPVEVRVVTFINSANNSASNASVPSGVATDSEFENMLDEVLSGNGSSSYESISGAGGTVTVDGVEKNVVSDNNFNSMLDDLGL